MSQHRQTETLSQVSGAGVTIKQPHDTFNNDEVGIARSIVKALGTVSLAGHPQIKLMYRVAAGQREPVRVKKIRPALEDPHTPALARMQPCQRTGDRGLTLARGRSGDEDGGAGGY